jgi:hypothetical protein
VESFSLTVTRGSMDRRDNPRIKSGDGDDGSGRVNLIGIRATIDNACKNLRLARLWPPKGVDAPDCREYVLRAFGRS